MKKIDIHIHTTTSKNMRINTELVLADVEHLRDKYKELGIGKGIILPVVSPECQFCIQSNEEVERIVSENSDMFYWFCNIDPRMGTNSEKTDFSVFLNHYKERGAKGVGEITACLYADDARVDNLFYHCAECDMPILIHVAPEPVGYYGLIDEPGLVRIEKMLQKYPKLKLIGHSTCFWAEIDSKPLSSEERNSYPKGKVDGGRVLELMRNYDNLYCDLSANSGLNALRRDPEFAYGFLEEFSDRIMFGTDICYPNQDMPLSFWLDKALEDGCISLETYKKVCFENAIRILKLD